MIDGLAAAIWLGGVSRIVPFDHGVVDCGPRPLPAPDENIIDLARSISLRSGSGMSDAWPGTPPLAAGGRRSLGETVGPGVHNDDGGTPSSEDTSVDEVAASLASWSTGFFFRWRRSHKMRGAIRAANGASSSRSSSRSRRPALATNFDASATARQIQHNTTRVFMCRPKTVPVLFLQYIQFLLTDRFNTSPSQSELISAHIWNLVSKTDSETALAFSFSLLSDPATVIL